MIEKILNFIFSLFRKVRFQYIKKFEDLIIRLTAKKTDYLLETVPISSLFDPPVFTGRYRKKIPYSFGRSFPVLGRALIDLVFLKMGFNEIPSFLLEEKFGKSDGLLALNDFFNKNIGVPFDRFLAEKKSFILAKKRIALIFSLAGIKSEKTLRDFYPVRDFLINFFFSNQDRDDYFSRLGYIIKNTQIILDNIEETPLVNSGFINQKIRDMKVVIDAKLDDMEKLKVINRMVLSLKLHCLKLKSIKMISEEEAASILGSLYKYLGCLIGEHNLGDYIAVREGVRKAEAEVNEILEVIYNSSNPINIEKMIIAYNDKLKTLQELLRRVADDYNRFCDQGPACEKSKSMEEIIKQFGISIKSGEELLKNESLRMKLKKRYHALCHENHPDKFYGASDEFKKEKTENIQNLNSDYKKIEDFLLKAGIKL